MRLRSCLASRRPSNFTLKTAHGQESQRVAAAEVVLRGLGLHSLKQCPLYGAACFASITFCFEPFGIFTDHGLEGALSCPSPSTLRIT